jgi:hypothetical protein
VLRARVLVPIVLAAALAIGNTALAAAADYMAGLVRYARVDRSDGTYREMLVDAATLVALRKGGSLGDGATVLMESYTRQGEIGAIFGKRREGGRWVYGS